MVSPKSEPFSKASATAIVQIVSSVKLQSGVNSVKFVWFVLLNSNRDPTISPMIAPNIFLYFSSITFFSVYYTLVYFALSALVGLVSHYPVIPQALLRYAYLL